MSPAAASPESNSPLLKLPAELRNYIYELVIENKPRIASLLTRDICEFAMEHDMRFTAEYDTYEPALLAVCRTIRREAKGMFYKKRPCKVLLLASSCDEAEMTFWEDQLLRLFSRPGIATSAFSAENNAPNLATWERAIRWLRDAQIKTSHGGSAGGDDREFESEETVIFCAVDEVTRNTGRKPWGLVEEECPGINCLLQGIFRSAKKDDWRRL